MAAVCLIAPRAWSQVELTVQAPGWVLPPLCADHLGHANDSETAKMLLRLVVVAQDRKRPQTSSRSGMHPMGLACQDGGTSVSAGKSRFCGPGWT